MKAWAWTPFAAAIVAVIHCDMTRGGTLAGATAPNYAESLVQNPAQNWKGVCRITIPLLPARTCSGVLIDARHVLTAGHCFFPADDGTGQQIAVLPTIFLDEFAAAGQLAVSKVDIAPGYDSGVGKGHRVAGNDLAIITLQNPVDLTKTMAWPINKGQIEDERRPLLETIKIGYGRSGNGVDGSAGGSGMKRFFYNRVDQYGGQNIQWDPDAEAGRNQPPPANTLVYDFDDPSSSNSSSLPNFYDQEFNLGLGMLEGCPASGDSGGPMFQRLDSDGPWYVVGVTSSGSRAKSKFGTVAYDTRLNVQAYQNFINSVVPEPTTIACATLVGSLIALRRRSPKVRRTANPA